MNKSAFSYLLNILTESLSETKKSFGIPPFVKLSACLRFFAEDGYQKGVGRDYEVGMAQSTFCEVLSKVLDALEKSLCAEWINIRQKKKPELIVRSSTENLPYPASSDVLMEHTSIL